MTANETTDADRRIEALRAARDDIADRVASLDEAALAGPSGAGEWDVAQVLGHLGSAAEIGSNTLGAALEGKPPPCVGLDTALRGAVAPVVISRLSSVLGDRVTTALGGVR
jgi:hypothetical protein